MLPAFDIQEAVPCGSAAEGPRWYACYTRARHEKRVERLLSQRGLDSYLPLVQQRHQWKDRKKVVQVALFPSYVFARFPLCHLPRVLATPGVVNIVRSAGLPMAVEYEEIENVRLLADALSAVEPQPQLVALPRIGDRVFITSGAFEGISGIVIQRRKRCRILVGLSALGQAVPIEVDASSVRLRSDRANHLVQVG